MTGDVTITRRGLLMTTAGAVLVAYLPGRALGQDASSPSPTVGPALEPEVVTLTDTSFTAWWRTDAPQDTTVRVTALDGPSAGTTVERRFEDAVTVHVAQVDGLRPGTRYRYDLLSGGRPVTLDRGGEADPGEVTTLVRPTGRRLARIALLNDIHVGEQCSGTITDRPGTSVPACYSAPDYSHRMLVAAIDEIAQLDDVDMVLANGDLSDRGREDDIARSLAQLRRLGKPLQVTRGNHDRRLTGACAADGDCLRSEAFPGNPVGDATLKSVQRVGSALTVVGLDSADPVTGKGRLDLGDQAAYLDEQLTIAAREHRDAIVAFHHPVLAETTPPSPSDKVEPGNGGSAILAVLAKHPHVRLVLHGHTHRNNLGYDPDIGPRLPFLENGAIKEYPAGYAILDVHEDGIYRTFHRPTTAFAREWVKTSAQEINGLQTTVCRGPLSSRAFVTSYTPTTGLAAPYAAPRVTIPSRRTARRLTTDGLRPLVVAAPGSEVSITVTARIGRGGQRRTIARQSIAVGEKGSIRARLRVAAALRRRLARHGSTRALLTAVVTQPGAPAVTVRRGVTIA